MTKKTLEICERLYNRTTDEFPYKKVKMIAFLLKGNKIIDYGINSERTDPVQQKYGKIYRQKINYKSKKYYIDKRHAEIDLLKNYLDKDIDFSKYTLFVLSKHNDNTYRNSRPCPICMEFLNNNFNLGEICYIYNSKLVTERKISEI